MAKLKLPPPTINYLLALRRENETIYRDDDLQIDLMRSIRALTRPVQIDQAYRLTDIEVRDPSLTVEMQRVTAALSLNDPKLVITTLPTAGEKGERATEDRAEWTRRVLNVCGKRYPGSDTFRDAVDACACDGAGWTRLIFKNDIWENRWNVASKEAKEYDKKTETAKKEAGPPFLWESIDVRTLYPTYSAGRLAEVMIITKRPKNQALRQYRLLEDRNGRFISRDDIQNNVVPEEVGLPTNVFDYNQNAPFVYVIEHWDDTNYSIVIENNIRSSVPDQANARLVKQLEHGYGRPPFFVAYGYQFNWQKQRKVAWSIGESKRWLTEFRSFLLTLYAQEAVRDALRPVVRTRAKNASATQGEDRQPSSKEFWEPREIINLEDGEMLTVLDFGNGPVTLEKMMAYMDKLIDSLSPPRITPEIGGGDPGSGFAITQILAETSAYEDPITKHIEQMLDDVTHFLWHLVRTKIKETVWVQSNNSPDGWLGQGPDDLPEGIGTQWSLDPERASAKLIEHRDIHERMDHKTIGPTQAIEKMGDVNPDEVEDDWELARIKTTSWYIQRHDQILLQKLQAGDALEYAAQQIVNSGQLPGQGTASGMQAMGNQVVPDMGNLAAGGNAGQPGGAPMQQAPTGGPNPQSNASQGTGALAQAAAGIPARASGGPVIAGQPTLVGEQGPELFVPPANGTIVPNQGDYGHGTTDRAMPIPQPADALDRAQGATPTPDSVRAYIIQSATARGIDPAVALRVANSEGGLDPSGWLGDNNSSYYPYQLHWGGLATGGNAVKGLGDEFTNQTGFRFGDMQGWRHSIDFALDTAKTQGWDPNGRGFHGATRAGIPNWKGIRNG